MRHRPLFSMDYTFLDESLDTITRNRHNSPMHSDEPDDDGHTLGDLCDLSGVSPRTVRYYIQQGLLPAAPRSGPGARYPAATLPRLRFIRACQEDGWSLARIREHLEAHGDPQATLPDRTAPRPNAALDYLANLRAAQLPAPPQTRTATPSAPRALTRANWERISIDPNFELHVRRPLTVADNRRLDRLLQAIAEIFDPNP